MANKDIRCISRSTMLRELYWGCGGGVMECFSGAVNANLPIDRPLDVCPNTAARAQSTPIRQRT